MKITLSAGATTALNLQGQQFYYESGTEKIEVKYTGDETRSYELYAGQGFNVANGGRFNRLEITNEGAVTASIDFDISDGNKFDNRAKVDNSGILNVAVVSGAKPTVRQFPAVVNLPAGVATQILGFDGTRASALLYFSAQTWIGGSSAVTAANGYPINAGSDLPDANSAELWAISPVGGTVNIYTESY